MVTHSTHTHKHTHGGLSEGTAQQRTQLAMCLPALLCCAKVQNGTKKRPAAARQPEKFDKIKVHIIFYANQVSRDMVHGAPSSYVACGLQAETEAICRFFFFLVHRAALFCIVRGTVRKST